jgi:hypothetical protein
MTRPKIFRTIAMLIVLAAMTVCEGVLPDAAQAYRYYYRGRAYYPHVVVPPPVYYGPRYYAPPPVYYYPPPPPVVLAPTPVLPGISIVVPIR